MDSLPLCTNGTTTTANSFSTELSLPSLTQSRRSRNLSFAKKPRKKVLVFASKDDPPKLDQWDQMELKFGKMIGEDPKLTLAKIMARKLNPDMSYLEIEKSLQKKKGKGFSEIEELPFDVSRERKSGHSSNGLNLVRPVPKKGMTSQANEKSVKKEDKRPSLPDRKAVGSSRGGVPNVILRKPSLFDDDESETSSRFNISPNLALKMAKERQKETFSDMTLLRKPELTNTNPILDRENGISDGSPSEIDNETDEENLTLKEKPEPLNPSSYNEKEQDNLDQSLESKNTEARKGDESVAGLQPSDISSSGKSLSQNVPSATKSTESNSGIHADAPLLGRPKRLDQSVKAKADVGGVERAAIHPESYDSGLEPQSPITSPIKKHEENDWRRAEHLVKSGERAEVEVISSSTRGFAVSFGSLIGFLPYRKLAAKWKFLAFESWLRRRGLDPSKYKQSLGVIGSFETAGTVPTTESMLDPDFDKFDGEISPDMKLEDLLRIYDQEKLKFLSSFVGQKIKVSVILADSSSRRLIFSTKPKEKEELVEKKRNLMGRLSVGDVVKCCIKKIAYFGIFVEVEGVPALIHQTEVSWDATLDPASYFKIGQTVEAKVHQLDFSLERIFLSLKEIVPDPSIEALEAVVGDRDFLDGRLEAAQADTEWAEVESLIQELEQVEGIQSVSKGRYFLSPGLAPTFQVYMAKMLDDQYKLLARSGNRAQEVIVQTGLGKEEIKSVILTCTNRVQ